MADHPLKLLFFTLPDCGACIGMKKAKTLERFIEKHSNVALKDVVLEDVEDSKRAENKMADAYDVEATPTVIFEHAQYGEVGREEGGVSLKMLERAYEEACANVDNEIERAKFKGT